MKPTEAIVETMRVKTIRMGAGAVIILMMVMAVIIVLNLPSGDVCKDYLNPDETPLPIEVYVGVPSECVNTTRLYPDEKFTEEGITYTYSEYPELGTAVIYTVYEYNNFTYMDYLRDEGTFRGRWVINDRHDFFVMLKDGAAGSGGEVS